MGWLQRLVETYDACAGRPQFAHRPLPPLSHTPQQAHLEIVVNEHGRFQRARIVQKEETLVPATEESANRTGSRPPPHPLCDKIQYVAGDYRDHGGTRPSFHGEYIELLRAWCESAFSHPKARAVLTYVERGSTIKDLVEEKLLHVGTDGRLLTKWPDTAAKSSRPAIFGLLAATPFDQGAAFVRWQVEIPGGCEPAVWLDASLQEAWVRFNETRMNKRGLCMATGGNAVALATSHPKRLRHPGDGAKLISANDASGFTFRGRFTDDTGEQACSVGYEASQKAHLALRWLIARQGARSGEQVVVAWAVGGEDIPDPLGDTFALFGLESPGPSPSEAPVDSTSATDEGGDAGQFYALALGRKIAGYRASLSPLANVVIMAIDSATPGRMAIRFYREFAGAEFLDRVEAWHRDFAWHQSFGKQRRFTGAPAPSDIADAAYGHNVDERLRRACVERLLPCIVDRQPLPRDLVAATVRRVTRRSGLAKWEWEKALGIACALFRGHQHQLKQGNYAMALETDRTTRDYLFGRLLALAEHLEQRALYFGGEQRDTHAARLMQRFADHPCATWRQIDLALAPSRSRLRSRAPGYLHRIEQQIDEVIGHFRGSNFTDDRKLSGEFLLGYHCQRAELNQRKAAVADDPSSQPSEPSETPVMEEAK